MQKQSSKLLGGQREFTYDGETIVRLFWLKPKRLTTQSERVRIELSMAADAIDTIEPFSAASSDNLHANQLCADLQKLVDQDDLLDCTIMATKDNREIKVCGIFCKILFSPAMHADYRPRVCFFACDRRFFVKCS